MTDLHISRIGRPKGPAFDGYINISKYPDAYVSHNDSVIFDGCNLANSTLCYTCNELIGGTFCELCNCCNSFHLHWWDRDGYCDDCLDIPMLFPEIIVLCGSTRFIEEFDRQSLKFTLEGKIVLSVGSHRFNDKNLNLIKEQKIMLDALHKSKIDLADKVYVINYSSYIGESTRSEIEYAKQHNKPIEYLEDPNVIMISYHHVDFTASTSEGVCGKELDDTNKKADITLEITCKTCISLIEQDMRQIAFGDGY